MNNSDFLVRSVKYGECQRNHVAHVGGYAVDGCREFMPSEEHYLLCAACGCHCNFHRNREVDLEVSVESSSSSTT